MDEVDDIGPLQIISMSPTHLLFLFR